MYITKEKLIKELQELPDGTNMYFVLIPNNGKEEDTDQYDIELNWVGVTDTSLLDTASQSVEFGFQVNKKTDISHFQDLLR